MVTGCLYNKKNDNDALKVMGIVIIFILRIKKVSLVNDRERY